MYSVALPVCAKFGLSSIEVTQPQAEGTCARSAMMRSPHLGFTVGYTAIRSHLS